MKQNWTEQMRHKLEGHEQAPPGGLWEGISEQMGLTPAPRRSALPVRWWWGAAAAAAILLGLLAVWSLADRSPASPVGQRQVALVRRVVRVFPEVAPSQPVLQTLPPSVPSLQQLLAEAGPLVAEAQADGEGPAPEPGNEEAGNEAPGNEAPRNETPQDATPSDAVREPLPSERDAWKAKDERGAGRLLSLDIEVAGPLMQAQALHSQRQMYFANVGTPYGAPEAEGGPARPAPHTLADHVAKHHPPLRLGVGLHYRLSRRVALLTGLRYTHLHSRFAIPLYENLTTDQHLHYLGLPLGVSFQLWGNRHFRFYASASAALDKCLNDEPWQWSAFASAGAEYLPAPRLGLYAEPSVGYYFKDGTPLQHYYKQHPWAPSIEVGLRVHVGK